MNFVIDIGNSNTVLGVFENDQLLHEWRIRTEINQTADEYGILLKSLFDHKNISFSDFEGVIVSSVVPPIMSAVEEMCQKYFKLNPMFIGRKDVDLLIKMNYPHPEEIGADRIVNAVGALHKYEAPLIIIDFGTATTFCYINEKGEYTGGLISPGIKISLEALYQKASKLPKVEIVNPKKVIGKSTITAMQSGIFYGYLTQIDGIIERIRKEVNREPTVIATGGLASLLAKDSEEIHYVEPHLTLMGLNVIYQKNT